MRLYMMSFTLALGTLSGIYKDLKCVVVVIVVVVVVVVVVIVVIIVVVGVTMELPCAVYK